MSTIVITGASSGIGAHAAGTLAEAGHEIVVVGRNRGRTDAVAASTGGRALYVDFDGLDSVRDLAAELLATVPRIDVLLNNAGGLVSERGVTKDGHERTLQHNHLAPFLLTNLLRERLEESDGRVVSTSSVMNLIGHVRLDDLEWERRRWFGGWRTYGTAKLATVLFAQELARRTTLESYSVHPGYVSTGFGSDSRFIKASMRLRSGGFGVPVAEGAAPLVRLATDPAVPGPNGGYFDRMTPNGRTARQSGDAELASALWDRSAALVGIGNGAGL